ncbi:hypothetical protein Fmac_005164 [Flemingia macrophylla]|uniref:PB1 domain-containing protein n=1 Tax=Flemingia macrophylla TaxID=520843 RepID=A0ABD1N711_9FABA
MENYQYPPSYPDSGDSSPRSREIDFENPGPWDEQQNQNYKAKFMCSYGGKIQPRSHDNQLSYVGGDTKILAVERSIRFSAFLSKVAAVCTTGAQEVSLKYQLPGEELDALISVTNDDDLDHMMHEYDRLYRPNSKPVRMRLFLFDQPDAAKPPPSNVDFLFGLDSHTALSPSPPPPPPPPHAPSFAAVNFHDPLPDPAASLPLPVPDPNVHRHLHQEMHRLQIAQTEYRRRPEDGFPAGYAAAGADYYLQKPPEKPSPPGYWPEKQFSGEGYQTTVTTAPGGGDQPMYVMSAPGTFYPAPVVRQQPQAAAQGFYAVPRMGSEGYREQAVYGGVAPASGKAGLASAGTVKGSAYAEGYGVVRPGAVADSAGYAQVAYDSASGRQVYYTAPGGVVHAPPQYQGVPPVGQDGKVVNKVSQGSV